MRFTRLVVPVAVVAAALAISASPASAVPYPPAGPVVTVSDDTIVVGETVEITVTGFGGSEEVAFARVVGVAMGTHSGPRTPALTRVARESIVADETGAFSHRLTLTEPGRHTITYSGTRSGLVASVSVLVVGSRTELPTTGTSGAHYLRLGLVGLACVLAGSLLVAFTVRRRRSATRTSR